MSHDKLFSNRNPELHLSLVPFASPGGVEQCRSSSPDGRASVVYRCPYTHHLIAYDMLRTIQTLNREIAFRRNQERDSGI